MSKLSSNDDELRLNDLSRVISEKENEMKNIEALYTNLFAAGQISNEEVAKYQDKLNEMLTTISNLQAEKNALVRAKKESKRRSRGDEASAKAGELESTDPPKKRRGRGAEASAKAGELESTDPPKKRRSRGVKPSAKAGKRRDRDAKEPESTGLVAKRQRKYTVSEKVVEAAHNWVAERREDRIHARGGSTVPEDIHSLIMNPNRVVKINGKDTGKKAKDIVQDIPNNVKGFILKLGENEENIAILAQFLSIEKSNLMSDLTRHEFELFDPDTRKTYLDSMKSDCNEFKRLKKKGYLIWRHKVFWKGATEEELRGIVYKKANTIRRRQAESDMEWPANFSLTTQPWYVTGEGKTTSMRVCRELSCNKKQEGRSYYNCCKFHSKFFAKTLKSSETDSESESDFD